MLVEKAGKYRHYRNAAAHRYCGVDSLQADHFASLASRDLAHRRQMAHRKGAAVEDLRDDKPG